MITALLISTLWAIQASPEQGEQGRVAEQDRERSDPTVREVVFLDEDRPIFIRLELSIDGRPVESVWRDNLERSFGYLDRDKSGALTNAELDAAIWRGGPRTTSARPSFASNLFSRLTKPLSAAPEAAPADTVPEITLERFAELFREKQPEFRIRTVARVGTSRVHLSELIDADGDGAFSADELEHAAQRLRKLDLNDDELISVAELQQYLNPFALAQYQAYQENATADSPRFVLLETQEQRGRLANRLLNQYGAEVAGERTVPVDRLHMSEAVAQHCDADGDGRFSATELATLVERFVPHVTLKLEVAAEEGHEAAVRPAAGAVTQGGLSVQASTHDTACLRAAWSQIEFDAIAGGRNDFRATYRQQFQFADGDNNKYVDRDEANRIGVFGVAFSIMDQDSDGKLFAEELDNFLNRLHGDAASRMELSVTELGQELFPFLDANGDGRLSPRELGEARDRAMQFDRDGDGKIELRELPRCFRASAMLGQPTPIAGMYFDSPVVAVDRVRVPPQTAGPTWFQRMDRNRDGDLSPREFLPPRELFLKLDENGDGRIDAREAEKAGS